jgi:hypothetical protein
MRWRLILPTLDRRRSKLQPTYSQRLCGGGGMKPPGGFVNPRKARFQARLRHKYIHALIVGFII